MSRILSLISILCVSACTAQRPISDFADCVAAGNPVLRSYPAQCVDKDGRIFRDTPAAEDTAKLKKKIKT